MTEQPETPTPRAGNRGVARRGLTAGHIYCIIICATLIIIVLLASLIGETC